MPVSSWFDFSPLESFLCALPQASSKDNRCPGLTLQIPTTLAVRKADRMGRGSQARSVDVPRFFGVGGYSTPKDATPLPIPGSTAPSGSMPASKVILGHYQPRNTLGSGTSSPGHLGSQTKIKYGRSSATALANGATRRADGRSEPAKSFDLSNQGRGPSHKRFKEAVDIDKIDPIEIDSDNESHLSKRLKRHDGVPRPGGQSQHGVREFQSVEQQIKAPRARRSHQDKSARAVPSSQPPSLLKDVEVVSLSGSSSRKSDSQRLGSSHDDHQCQEPYKGTANLRPCRRARQELQERGRSKGTTAEAPGKSDTRSPYFGDQSRQSESREHLRVIGGTEPDPAKNGEGGRRRTVPWVMDQAPLEESEQTRVVPRSGVASEIRKTESGVAAAALVSADKPQLQERDVHIVTVPGTPDGLHNGPIAAGAQFKMPQVVIKTIRDDKDKVMSLPDSVSTRGDIPASQLASKGRRRLDEQANKDNQKSRSRPTRHCFLVRTLGYNIKSVGLDWITSPPSRGCQLTVDFDERLLEYSEVAKDGTIRRTSFNLLDFYKVFTDEEKHEHVILYARGSTEHRGPQHSEQWLQFRLFPQEKGATLVHGLEQFMDTKATSYFQTERMYKHFERKEGKIKEMMRSSSSLIDRRDESDSSTMPPESRKKRPNVDLIDRESPKRRRTPVQTEEAPAKERLIDQLQSPSTVHTNSGPSTKRPGTRSQTRASTNRSNGQARNHDKEESPEAVKPQLPPKAPRPPEWTESLVYPPEGSRKTMVDWVDLDRLDDGEFLNDNIIAFYLRFLEHCLEQADSNAAKRVYIFNTFFYERLASAGRGRRGINYDAVSKWTSKVDIFDYDYVVVPINESAHWYLAIICNLGNLVKPRPSSPEDVTNVAAAKPQTGPDNLPGPDKAKPDHSNMSPSKADESNTPRSAGSLDRAGDRLAQMSFTVLEVDDDHTAPGAVDRNVADKSTKHEGIYEDFQSDAPEAETMRVTQVKDPPASQTVHIDATADDGADDSRSRKESCGGSKKSPKRRPRGKSFKRVDADEPAIVILDSLGFSHPATIRNLKEYLVREAETKRHVKIQVEDISGLTARGIPQQENYCDCGLYLLGYMEKFLQDPSELVRRLLQRERFEDEDWPRMHPSEMRVEIRDILIKLADDQAQARKLAHKEQALRNGKYRDKKSLGLDKPVKRPPAATKDAEFAQARPTTNGDTGKSRPSDLAVVSANKPAHNKSEDAAQLDNELQSDIVGRDGKARPSIDHARLNSYSASSDVVEIQAPPTNHGSSMPWGHPESLLAPEPYHQDQNDAIIVLASQDTGSVGGDGIILFERRST